MWRWSGISILPLLIPLHHFSQQLLHFLPQAFRLQHLGFVCLGEQFLTKIEGGAKVIFKICIFGRAGQLPFVNGTNPYDNYWETSFDWIDEDNDGYDDRDDGFLG